MNSLLKILFLLQKLQELFAKHNEMIRVESSAKQIILKISETLFKSLMYIKNNNGPRTLPCGTPVLVSKKSESILLKETYCLQS